MISLIGQVLASALIESPLQARFRPVARPGSGRRRKEPERSAQKRTNRPILLYSFTYLAKLAKIGMVREITGGRYGRLYAYDGYLGILAPDE